MSARQRNPEREQDTFRQALGFNWVYYMAVFDSAQERANSLSGEYVPDPMLVAPRDHPHEAQEELADACNRVIWWLEENPDHPDFHRREQALEHIALAYHHLT